MIRQPPSGKMKHFKFAILDISENTIRASENAQKLEEKRLMIYNEIASQNEALGSGSNKDYRKYEIEIARRIRTITGTKENVRVKANELIKPISDSTCPQSINIAMFAQKVVSLCVNKTGSFNSAVYAYGRVIVLVTSKVNIISCYFIIRRLTSITEKKAVKPFLFLH
nr:protein GLE1-like [Nicotiana tomentosiformis]